MFQCVIAYIAMVLYSVAWGYMLVLGMRYSYYFFRNVCEYFTIYYFYKMDSYIENYIKTSPRFRVSLASNNVWKN